jgi:Fe2+ or Zn2+ uptake regulation protein
VKHAFLAPLPRTPSRTSAVLYSHDATREKRTIWQREVARQAPDASSDFVSAQRLHARLHDVASPVGLATIYRALNDLEAKGAAASLPPSVSRETCASRTTDAMNTEIGCSSERAAS